MIKTLHLKTKGQGLHEITDEIIRLVVSTEVREGLCTLFIQHTSASLTIQENADPSARRAPKVTVTRSDEREWVVVPKHLLPEA
jgi:secondary thiamine-phosphate synthase enzyme